MSSGPGQSVPIVDQDPIGNFDDLMVFVESCLPLLFFNSYIFKFAMWPARGGSDENIDSCAVGTSVVLDDDVMCIA